MLKGRELAEEYRTDEQGMLNVEGERAGGGISNR